MYGEPICLLLTESDKSRSEQKHFVTGDMLRSNFEDFMVNAQEQIQSNSDLSNNEKEMVDHL